MLADGLTKLSSSGAQVEAIRKALDDNLMLHTFWPQGTHELRKL